MGRIVTHRHEIRVEFHHVDMMQVAHNSEYFRWFERGRLELFEEVFPMQWMIDNRIGAPVVANRCEYTWPAVYGDTLVVTTRHRLLDSYAGRFDFDHSIVRPRDRRELASGRTSVTLVDLARYRLVKEIEPAVWARYQRLGERP